MKKVLLSSVVLGVTFFSLSTKAAGPIIVDTEQTGQAVVWENDVIRYNLESGDEATLGTLSNSEAVALMRELFQDWQNVTINGVSTVSMNIVEGISLGSVNVSNMNDHFSYCPPSADDCPDETSLPFIVGSAGHDESPILFDDDGSMIDAVEGQGASRSILGFAGPRTIERRGGELVILEGQAILNGKFINGVDAISDPEVSVDEFKGVILHEIGHFMGVDHSQVNLSSAIKYFAGDHSEKTGIPTMFPILVDGEEQLSLHYDDKVAISTLYPSAAFGSSFCVLQGKIFYSDGRHEMQGVNVFAQNPSNPLEESTSFVSGSYYTGTNTRCSASAGQYFIYGLQPGTQYKVGFEAISASFTGGSSIEPCDPPQRGFVKQTVSGFFSCSSGGSTIQVGTQATTDFVTSKTYVPPVESSAGSSGGSAGSGGGSSGGCSLIPE